jgi:hypothetical protein
MGFWNKRETDLERELRARRPKPSDEFVRSLSRLVEPTRRSRRVALPKVALVAAVTAMLAASLGVAGAFGYAADSFHAFGNGVSHLVRTPTPAVHLVKPSGSTTAKPAPIVRSTGGSTSSRSTAGTPSTSVTPAHHDPYQWQYGVTFPICWYGQLIYVPLNQLLWYEFHGAKPWYECGGFPIHR